MAKLTKPANQFQKSKDIMTWTVHSLSVTPNKAVFSVKTKEVFLTESFVSIPDHVLERPENFWVFKDSPHRYCTEDTGYKSHPLINYPELRTWRLIHNL